MTPSPIPILRFVLNPTNMRTGPGTEYTVIEIIQPDDPLIFLEENDDQSWNLVAMESGVEGWIGRSMLAPIEE